uniref:Putative secreted protein n=1 Tax=Amblyomma cajennense TaxID=34607 RepID=A0A023FF77_AMBCJ
MNLIDITLVACILLALACPLSASGKCPGSCTQQSCYSNKGASKDTGKTRYFPNKVTKKCEAYSSDRNCQGKFYETEQKCTECCKSYLQ